MAEVGIRELNQQTGRVLRRVAAGESLVVTDHGRPVAMLVPLPESKLDQLVIAGQATVGESTLRPVAPVKLPRSTAEILAELNDDRL